MIQGNPLHVPNYGSINVCNVKKKNPLSHAVKCFVDMAKERQTLQKDSAHFSCAVHAAEMG